MMSTRSISEAMVVALALMVSFTGASTAWSAEICGAEGWEEDLLQWREERNEALKEPEGWLSLVGLYWLEEGRQSLGSGGGNQIRLPEGLAADEVGWLDLRGDEIWMETAPGVAVTTREGYKVRRIPLPSDASGEPTVLAHRNLRFHAIHRGDRYALRVKDLENPALEKFQGTRHFPPDPSFCLEARFEPADPPRTLEIPTVMGTVDEQPSPGALVFRVDGREYRLDATDAGGGGLFVVFGDLTNGTDSYGGGRFLTTEAPTDTLEVTLDFNRAYSPPCAFTAFATCPLPPRQNRLDVAIPAGEMASGQNH